MEIVSDELAPVKDDAGIDVPSTVSAMANLTFYNVYIYPDTKEDVVYALCDTEFDDVAAVKTYFFIVE